MMFLREVLKNLILNLAILKLALSVDIGKAQQKCVEEIQLNSLLDTLVKKWKNINVKDNCSSEEETEIDVRFSVIPLMKQTSKPNDEYVSEIDLKQSKYTTNRDYIDVYDDLFKRKIPVLRMGKKFDKNNIFLAEGETNTERNSDSSNVPLIMMEANNFAEGPLRGSKDHGYVSKNSKSMNPKKVSIFKNIAQQHSKEYTHQKNNVQKLKMNKINNQMIFPINKKIRDFIAAKSKFSLPTTLSVLRTKTEQNTDIPRNISIGTTSTVLRTEQYQNIDLTQNIALTTTVEPEPITSLETTLTVLSMEPKENTDTLQNISLAETVKLTKTGPQQNSYTQQCPFLPTTLTTESERITETPTLATDVKVLRTKPELNTGITLATAVKVLRKEPKRITDPPTSATTVKVLRTEPEQITDTPALPMTVKVLRTESERITETPTLATAVKVQRTEPKPITDTPTLATTVKVQRMEPKIITDTPTVATTVKVQSTEPKPITDTPQNVSLVTTETMLRSKPEQAIDIPQKVVYVPDKQNKGFRLLRKYKKLVKAFKEPIRTYEEYKKLLQSEKHKSKNKKSKKKRSKFKNKKPAYQNENQNGQEERKGHHDSFVFYEDTDEANRIKNPYDIPKYVDGWKDVTNISDGDVIQLWNKQKNKKMSDAPKLIPKKSASNSYYSNNYKNENINNNYKNNNNYNYKNDNNNYSYKNDNNNNNKNYKNDNNYNYNNDNNNYNYKNENDNNNSYKNYNDKNNNYKNDNENNNSYKNYNNNINNYKNDNSNKIRNNNDKNNNGANVPVYDEIVDRSVADDLAKSVRVLCWVLTSADNHETQAESVKRTWGKRCTVLVFFSDINDAYLPSFRMPVPDGESYYWGLTKEAFRYVYNRHKNDVDWYMKADDDTYVIIENLRYMLAKYKPDEPLYFGRRFKPYVNQGFMSGGAGYVLSREAVRRLVTIGLARPDLCLEGSQGSEDVEMGKCLESLEVQAVDTRDESQRERFMPFLPQNHLFPEKNQTYWYWNYAYYPVREGYDCCSEYPVSFHYADPEMMVVLEYFLYHSRVYGLNRRSFSAEFALP